MSSPSPSTSTSVSISALQLETEADSQATPIPAPQCGHKRKRSSSNGSRSPSFSSIESSEKSPRMLSPLRLQTLQPRSQSLSHSEQQCLSSPFRYRSRSHSLSHTSEQSEPSQQIRAEAAMCLEDQEFQWPMLDLSLSICLDERLRRRRCSGLASSLKMLCTHATSVAIEDPQEAQRRYREIKDIIQPLLANVDTILRNVKSGTPSSR